MNMNYELRFYWKKTKFLRLLMFQCLYDLTDLNTWSLDITIIAYCQRNRYLRFAIYTGLFTLIWMFRSSQLNNRINKIHEKDLKLLYEDKRLTFNDLFELDNSVTVHQQNLQILAAEIFKLKKQFSTWNNNRGIWNKTNSLQFGFWS